MTEKEPFFRMWTDLKNDFDKDYCRYEVERF